MLYEHVEDQLLSPNRPINIAIVVTSFVVIYIGWYAYYHYLQYQFNASILQMSGTLFLISIITF